MPKIILNLKNILEFSQRKRIFFFIVPLLILLLQGCKKNKNAKPNILIILADDLGYEKPGCYGGIGTHTPNLDRIAEQGTLFTRAYTSPVCTPSRMSIYTGMYAPHHKYTEVLPVHLGTKEFVDFSEFPCYAQYFRNAGYLTSVTGKWQLAALEFHPEHCQSAGFDSWCVWQIWHNNKKTTRYWNSTYNHDGILRSDIDDRFGPDVLTEYVIDQIIKAKEKNKPFLIHHNMVLPHVPIVQTPEDTSLNKEASLDLMIAYLDAQVGKILCALDSLNLTKNTLVIFAGDNGTQSNEPRMTLRGEVNGGKWDLTDGGTHVPLIAYWPGKVPGDNRAGDLIDFADFFPTLCEIANIPTPLTSMMDGISFAKPLLGTGPGQRKWVTAAIFDDFTVFNGAWRIHYQDNRLVDCRELPLEKTADTNSREARNAMDELLPIVKKLNKD